MKMKKNLYRAFKADKEYQKMITSIQIRLSEENRAKVIREAIEELYEEFKNGKSKNHNI